MDKSKTHKLLNASSHSRGKATPVSPNVLGESSASTSYSTHQAMHQLVSSFNYSQASNSAATSCDTQKHSNVAYNPNLVNRRQLFAHKLELFMQNRQQRKVTNSSTYRKPTAKVKLSDVKIDLQQAFNIIDELKSKREQLLTNVDNLASAEWQAHVTAIQEQQFRLQTLASKLNSAEFQQVAQEKIMQRQKRRSNIRQRKSSTKLLKKSLSEKRAAINAEIDDRLRLEQETVREKQRKADAAKRAEQILSGVTKKKAEAVRFIELFNALIELRRVRSIQSGRHDEGRQQEFVERIGRLKDIWLDAIVNYEREESELKKWLNDSDGYYEEWCRALFGTTNVIDLENPILKGERNFKELLRIR